MVNMDLLSTGFGSPARDLSDPFTTRSRPFEPFACFRPTSRFPNFPASQMVRFLISLQLNVLKEAIHGEDSAQGPQSICHIPFLYYYNPGNELQTFCHDLRFKSSLCRTLCPQDPANPKLSQESIFQCNLFEKQTGSPSDVKQLCYDRKTLIKL